MDRPWPGSACFAPWRKEWVVVGPVAEVERLIDERAGYTPRYELLDGQLLVTPSPTHRHQRLLGAAYRLLHAYVERQRLGEAVLSPAQVRLTPESYLEPDVVVVPAVDGRRPPAVDSFVWRPAGPSGRSVPRPSASQAVTIC